LRRQRSVATLLQPPVPEDPVPRARREDAPGSIHHVYARGLEGRAIFRDAADRADLLRRLAEVLPEGGARCPAWALIGNHLHLIVQTGEVRLSTLMRRIHTGFAVRFNLRDGRQGYLFQSRFGSRRVCEDGDLAAVLRYVLRNPLEAGLVQSLAALELFPWCAYGALLGVRPALPFESVDDALAVFDPDSARARTRLRAWMVAPDEVPVVTRAGAVATQRELDQLIRATCAQLGVIEADLRDGRRTREVSLARTRVCQRAIRELGLRPTDVARKLAISESAVSQALRRRHAVSEDGGPSPS